MKCASCRREWPNEFKVCPLCAASLHAELGEVASGAIAQAGARAAGERGGVAERSAGSVYTGDTIVLAREAAERCLQRFKPRLSQEDLRRVTVEAVQPAAQPPDGDGQVARRDGLLRVADRGPARGQHPGWQLVRPLAQRGRVGKGSARQAAGTC